MRLSLLGAPRPNLIASAMASLGSENPSWAQRNGRISSSGNFLQLKDKKKNLAKGYFNKFKGKIKFFCD